MYLILSSIEDRGRFLFHSPRTMRDIFFDTDNPIYQKYYKVLNGNQFKKLIYYLKKNNFVKSKNLQSKKAFILTRKGMEKAMRAGFKIESDDKQKREDGKWIMIIFDIPKKDERKRIILRSVLQNLGYKMFQKSVWITPYDVFENTEKMLQFYSLDDYIRIFLIEPIE